VLVVNWLYPLLADAMVPPLNWDEVAYHLAIPKIYIQHQSVVYIPFIPYSNWPLETEMLFTMSLLLSSETLAHLVSWTALLLISGGLYICGRRYFGGNVGLLAAAVFAATPMVGTLAGTALVELPLTLYTFLAMFAFLRGVETNRGIYWVLSAACGGLAASTKLSGVLVPLSLALLATVVMVRNKNAWRFSQAARIFLTYGLVAGFIVAPWYLKAWIQTGNPFWPFLSEIFGARNWDSLGTEYLLGFIRLPNMPLTPLNWLLGFWKQTQDPIGPQGIALGWAYALLLPSVVPALVLMSPTPRRILRWLVGIGLVYYTNWFFLTHQTRFLMPTLPVLALIAAAGVRWWEQAWLGRWRLAVQWALVLFVLASSWWARPIDRTRLARRWPFLAGQLTRDEFLRIQVPGYATFQYANAYLPEHAKIWLALYESRGYYLDHEYMWANPISQRALRLEQVASADQLAAELRARGFTHIVFNTSKLDSYLYIRFGPAITRLTRALLAEHTLLIYKSADVELYELLPE